MVVAEALVGHGRVGCTAADQLEALGQALHGQQLGLLAEAEQQCLEVLFLHRTGQHGNAPVVEVEQRVQAQFLLAVDLRPAEQRRQLVEVQVTGTFFVPGRIRQQVDAPVAGQFQALLPFAGHRLQLPAFALGDFAQQFAEDAGQLVVVVQQQFRFVGVDAYAQRLVLRLTGRSQRGGTQQQGGPEAQ
ncbi:hypothetical protein D3C78_1370910 [compost metagenome]